LPVITLDRKADKAIGTDEPGPFSSIASAQVLLPCGVAHRDARFGSMVTSQRQTIRDLIVVNMLVTNDWLTLLARGISRNLKTNLASLLDLLKLDSLGSAQRIGRRDDVGPRSISIEGKTGK